MSNYQVVIVEYKERARDSFSRLVTKHMAFNSVTEMKENAEGHLYVEHSEGTYYFEAGSWVAVAGIQPGIFTNNVVLRPKQRLSEMVNSLWEDIHKPIPIGHLGMSRDHFSTRIKDIIANGRDY